MSFTPEYKMSFANGAVAKSPDHAKHTKPIITAHFSVTISGPKGPYLYVFLNSLGEMPYFFLNLLLK